MTAYSKNAVYTKVVNDVISGNSAVTFCSRLQPYAESFPAIQLFERADVSVGDETLDFDGNVYNSTWEVQIFSNKQNGAEVEAYDIMDTVKASMKSLYYCMTMCEPVENIDPSIYRLVSRFTRTICGGDTMPTPSTSSINNNI